MPEGTVKRFAGQQHQENLIVTTLKVIGIPESQARPRMFMAGGRRIVHSPKTSWYHLVYGEGLKARPAEPFDVPVWLNVVFIFPRPKSLKKSASGWKGTRPDLDNLIKGVKDALTHARWWTDDGRVAREITEKRFSLSGEPCGAEITVGVL